MKTINLATPSNGRLIGALLLAQIVLGITASFVLGPPLKVPAALAAGFLTLVIAANLYPVLRGSNPASAVWIVMLAAISFALLAVENGLILAENREIRFWVHYLQVMASGVMFLGVYFALFRSALVPRILAGAGFIAVLLQLSSVAMPFLGKSVILPLLAPMALMHVVLGVWLIVRGWSGRTGPLTT